MTENKVAGGWLRGLFAAAVARYNRGMSLKWVLLFQRLDAIERKIVSTQAELAAQLQTEAAATAALTEKVTKIGAETSALLASVDALQAAIDAAGGTTAEVDAAVLGVTAAREALAAALEGVDALVPDAPAP
jgi:molecular chaperone GrpE (heat shock protein)